MHDFSQELIQRLQKYFAEKYEIHLSVEETEVYLNSMADLYDAVAGQHDAR